MATYTTNLNLEKPATSENFDLLKINANWDKIDSYAGTVNGKFSTIEDKKITRVSGTSYFTERDAFKARRVGNTIAIFSYVNITTQVPESTNFANTGFTSAEGTFLFFDSTSKATPVICTTGVLKPAGTLATGYYYAIGVAVTPI